MEFHLTGTNQTFFDRPLGTNGLSQALYNVITVLSAPRGRIEGNYIDRDEVPVKSPQPEV